MQKTILWLSLGLAACSNSEPLVSTSRSAIDATCSPSHYFGYYLFRGQNPLGDLGAVSDHSNVDWIQDPGLLASDAAAGMNAVLEVASIFFDGTALRSDWQSSWSSFASNPALTSNLARVAAFYPADEPNTQGNRTSDLQIAVNAIRASFPGKPIAVIYGSGFGSSAPDSIGLFDWVGVDCYTIGFGCRDDYKTEFNALKTHMRAGARTIVVPQTWLPGGQVTSSNAQALLSEMRNKYAPLMTDSSVVMTTLFLWQDEPAAPGQPALTGLLTLDQTFPNLGLLAAFRAAGQQFLGPPTWVPIFNGPAVTYTKVTPCRPKT